MLLLSGPNIAGNEWKYIKECLDTGWVSSVGSYVTKFENMVAEYAGCRFGVATSNGTTALHIALMLAGVKEDDYVLVPNVTFVASLNSIKYTGADPILMDVDRSTWQMDLDLLEEFLENETDEKNDELFYIKNGRVIRCIMPVHVLGNMIDMERLLQLAKKYKLKVIEDATESLGTYFKQKHTGSFGLMGCLVLMATKSLQQVGEALLLLIMKN